MKNSQPLSLGRIVHIRIGGSDEEPIWRPAICVKVQGTHRGNFRIFLDKDETHIAAVASAALKGSDRGDWQWPPRV